MITAEELSESMFVLVSKRADGKWYPFALNGCLLLFSTADRATTSLHRSKDIPAEAKVSRETGWERVVGVMRLARDEGATLVAVDPTDTVKAVPLDESLKAVENMLEQVALTATALLRRVLIASAERMGTPKPDMTLAEGVEVLGRVVRALVPQGEMAEAAGSIDVFVRSLAAKAAGVEPAPRFVFVPEGAVGMFVPWVEARIDRPVPGRGGAGGGREAEGGMASPRHDSTLNDTGEFCSPRRESGSKTVPKSHRPRCLPNWSRRWLAMTSSW